MYKLVTNIDAIPSVVQTNEHYFCCCECDILDQREGLSGMPKPYTFFFEAEDDDYRKAEMKCKSIASLLGLRITMIGNLIITTVPFDASKMWVHGKNLEK